MYQAPNNANPPPPAHAMLHSLSYLDCDNAWSATSSKMHSMCNEYILDMLQMVPNQLWCYVVPVMEWTPPGSFSSFLCLHNIFVTRSVHRGRSRDTVVPTDHQLSLTPPNSLPSAQVYNVHRKQIESWCRKKIGIRTKTLSWQFMGDSIIFVFWVRSDLPPRLPVYRHFCTVRTFTDEKKAVLASC